VSSGARAGTLTTLLIDLDGALGDTRPLWLDWIAESARVLELEPSALPADRAEAASVLDTSGAGNWRTLLERFAEDRAPVYLRPNAEASAALRRLQAAGARIGVFTDAPAELARVALSQLGATRRIDAVEAGAGAFERLSAALGPDALRIGTRDELMAVSS
jgi:phosphoglycolate phosphatase-like HAD superfamily hydrolase